MSNSPTVPPDPPAAFLIRILDKSLHAYMQAYPFLSGPDHEMNARCFEAVKEGIQIRNPSRMHSLKHLDRSDLVDESRLLKHMQETYARIGISHEAAKGFSEGLAWKMCLVQQGCEEVLSLGCGNGAELAALRSRLPSARICGMDWADALLPGLKKETHADFICGNFLELIMSGEREYDLIFANHVIEHFYEPDEVLATVFAMLKPGGSMVAALPLDGAMEGVFFKTLSKLASCPESIRRPDMFILNAGHPWKTNTSDLAETFKRSGFADVSINHRKWHPNIIFKGDSDALEIKRAGWSFLHRVGFRAIQELGSSIFGANVPDLLLKVLEALERRVPFGSNRLCSLTAPEVLVVAKKAR